LKKLSIETIFTKQVASHEIYNTSGVASDGSSRFAAASSVAAKVYPDFRYFRIATNERPATRVMAPAAPKLDLETSEANKEDFWLVFLEFADLDFEADLVPDFELGADLDPDFELGADLDPDCFALGADLDPDCFAPEFELGSPFV